MNGSIVQSVLMRLLNEILSAILLSSFQKHFEKLERRQAGVAKMI